MSFVSNQLWPCSLIDQNTNGHFTFDDSLSDAARCKFKTPDQYMTWHYLGLILQL